MRRDSQMAVKMGERPSRVRIMSAAAWAASVAPATAMPYRTSTPTAAHTAETTAALPAPRIRSERVPPLGGAKAPYGAHQNRLLGCYLDYNTLDMYDPTAVTIESTFFLETYANLHSVHGTLDGLVMRYNTFTAPQSIVLDGAFPRPKGVDISDSLGVAKATRARASLQQHGATVWSFNFTEQLLFPNIEQLVYSVVSDAPGFFQHVARTPQGATVVVETSAAVDATVIVEVAQAL